jgi:hypothetical protein
VSKNFERWKELAALAVREQNPAKLTELATEMNLVLNQKTPHLVSALHDDVLQANAGGKVCFT